MPDSPTTDPTPTTPWYAVDLKGFLAIAIVLVLFTVILILLLKDYTALNDKVFGALLTLLGVLAGCFKDVYGFVFGSSQSSKDKDTTISQMATAAAPSAAAAPITPAA